MANELNTLFPIQFIEGINENAEYEIDEDYRLSMLPFARIAIDYRPRVASVLSRADILILTDARTDANKPITAAIYSDYNGNPSDITLNDVDSFTLQVPREAYKVYWQQITLKPAILAPGNQYWLVLDVDRGFWALQLAKNDGATNLKVTNEKRWRTYEESHKTKVMVRFYGRLIPFFSETRN